jgi:hypothetical protein
MDLDQYQDSVHTQVTDMAIILGLDMVLDLGMDRVMDGVQDIDIHTIGIHLYTTHPFMDLMESYLIIQNVHVLLMIHMNNVKDVNTTVFIIKML